MIAKIYFILILFLSITDEEGILISILYIFANNIYYIKNKINFKNKNFLIEFNFISVCVILFIITKIFFLSETSYYQNTIKDESLFFGINNIFIFKEYSIIFLENLLFIFSGSFGFVGVNSILIILLTVIILLFNFKNVSNSKENFPIFVTIIFSILTYSLFNAALELIGGNRLMRSLNYYYGSSVFIINLFFFIYLFKNHKTLLNKYKLIVKFIFIIFIFFNLYNFKNINNLIMNLHFQNTNYEIFNTNLMNLKNHNCNEIINLKKLEFVNQKDEFLEMLAKINMNQNFYRNLINEWNGMDPSNYMEIAYVIYSECNYKVNE